MEPGMNVTPQSRLTCRDLGVCIGRLPPGPSNSIVDVAPVRVGHFTLRNPPQHHTGITAILPHSGAPPLSPIRAAVEVGNGFGKLIGSTQIAETGLLESPILLTNTLAAFAVADALVQHVLALPGCEHIRSFNPVVGETNDGVLNDIRTPVLGAPEVAAAIADASDAPVWQGCVGAGTGTISFGWKGGIGSASRQVQDGRGRVCKVGVLVQSNFGGHLTIAGVPIRILPRPASDTADLSSLQPPGSIMIVVATDAPLDQLQLRRLARRSLFGIARTGGVMAHGSGDYALAFSVAQTAEQMPIRLIDGLFEAVVEASEEAIVNALFTAESTVGHRGAVEALPVDTVLQALRSADT
jgi:D-aminopeptidase